MIFGTITTTTTNEYHPACRLQVCCSGAAKRCTSRNWDTNAKSLFIMSNSIVISNGDVPGLQCMPSMCISWQVSVPFLLHLPDLLLLLLLLLPFYGLTDIAGVDIDGGWKKPGWTLQEWTMTEEIAEGGQRRSGLHNLHRVEFCRQHRIFILLLFLYVSCWTKHHRP